MTARAIGGVFKPKKFEPVWRESFDVDSVEAKPWQRLFDGSREVKRLVVNAVLRTCGEEITEHRRRALALKREWRARPAASPGAELAEAEAREKVREQLRELLRVGDDRVLAAYLDDYNPETGELFTAQATIAAELGIGVSEVNRALARLRTSGYIDWVRRSRPAPTAGGAGPQKEQASSAYFFSWKAQLSPRAWARLWQLILAGLKKAGKAAIATTVALFTRLFWPAGKKGLSPRSSRRPGPRSYVFRVRSAIQRTASNRGQHDEK